MKVLEAIANLLRGALIGTVEIIPGVSGGTVALILGVYEDLIRGASHLLKGLGGLPLVPFRAGGLERASRHFREVPWPVLLPILAGAAVALFTVASPLSELIENHPQASRAVFFGLIAASVAVPLRMSGSNGSVRDLALVALAAAAGFGLTSLPGADISEPAAWLIMLSAAFAVCALVLPGVSGSYLLLAIGMYEPTLTALSGRNWGYLALFIAGAVIGLALFVQLLQWLLEHRRRPALLVMAGLMIGSLRSLWPWQSAEGTLQPAGPDVLLMLALALGAAAVVVIMLLLERRSTRAPVNRPAARRAER